MDNTVRIQVFQGTIAVKLFCITKLEIIAKTSEDTLERCTTSKPGCMTACVNKLIKWRIISVWLSLSRKAIGLKNLFNFALSFTFLFYFQESS